jgi:hypothetical protein
MSRSWSAVYANQIGERRGHGGVTAMVMAPIRAIAGAGVAFGGLLAMRPQSAEQSIGRSSGHVATWHGERHVEGYAIR